MDWGIPLAEKLRPQSAFQDVKQMFFSMNSIKASGPDGIPGNVLWACANQVSPTSRSENCLTWHYHNSTAPGSSTFPQKPTDCQTLTSNIVHRLATRFCVEPILQSLNHTADLRTITTP
ncbi:hypothetical protein CRENBAI_004388 [Crenichthys baileyi]|uniref:Reverse transcriptase n=1 Tax=Crenichthys baileyi TaxID=28760 RepID=A0AAV9RV51_9TELE